MRRLTVSELIRESKPDWEHVKTREKRTSTGAFSGAPVVSTGVTGIHDKAGRLVGGTIDMDYAEGFQAQMDRFDEQNLSGETQTFWEGSTLVVDDQTFMDETGTIQKTGEVVFHSRLPDGS